jgi:hypothetical protein
MGIADYTIINTKVSSGLELIKVESGNIYIKVLCGHIK